MMIYKVESKISFILKVDTMIRSMLIQQNKKNEYVYLKT